MTTYKPYEIELDFYKPGLHRMRIFGQSRRFNKIRVYITDKYRVLRLYHDDDHTGSVPDLTPPWYEFLALVKAGTLKLED